MSVGPASTPIPLKLVEKIWRGDYIELHELLPTRLGAPGPTTLDALLQSDKIKHEDWVLCFNTLVSVIAMRTPEQASDLLAYSSTTVKASHYFEGLPWIDYDVHFRRQIATQSSPKWGTIDAALWIMYFTRATPKPASTPPTGDRNQPSQDKRQQGQSKYRYTPYPTNRVCFRWNSQAGCHLINCKFLHCCLRCRDTSHTAIDSPQRKLNTMAPHSQEQPPTGTNFRPPGRR